MQNTITAFADEYGNNYFDFTSQGTHFIVATVISKNDNLDVLKEQVEEIKRKHGFQTGELKSRNVGPNHQRRLRVLKDIAVLDVAVYAVVVDKRQLSGKGFDFKKSFYKYLNNLLYKELFRTFPKLELVVDEHGDSDYMLEFKRYVEKHHQRNLFSGSEFIIQNSRNSYFIQLADFIAGSLGHIYDEPKRSAHSQEFLDTLKPIITSINFFPHNFTFEELQASNVDESFDPKIAGVSHSRIHDFLETETGSDQQKSDQINFLKLMLLFQRANAKNKYISTKEIFAHLNQSRSEELKEEYFRTKVVGSLRDKGILIASGKDGYKIPTSSADLQSFINHGKRIIMPMLNRIKEARKAVRLATGNDLDLLEQPGFAELRKLLDN